MLFLGALNGHFEIFTFTLQGDSSVCNFNLIKKKVGKQCLYSEHRPLEFDIDFNTINHQNFDNPVISSAPRPIMKRT